MNRRALLRVATAAVGGGAATAAGLSVATESAAQTGLTLDVAGDSAEIGTGGSVSEVQLDLDVEWAYDLPSETAPSTVIVEVAAGPADGSVSVVGSRGGRRRRQPVDQHRIAACGSLFSDC